MAVIISIALAALSMIIVLLFTSAFPASGRFELHGLNAPVTVYRDDWSIPHIFAETDEDASFALGWVHAEDRLWQMEAMRRSGAGRLAEILGPAALPSDRRMRTLGLYRLAEHGYEALTNETKRKFDAYARGVNAWLKLRSGLLPPEFLLLRFEPEPWTPADSLVWLKLMALRLSSDHRNELLRARLGRRLSQQQLHDLWPEMAAGTPTTLALASGLDPTVMARLSAVLQDSPGQSYGASNAWVVAGSRTASGKPILANDPHLGFTMPPPWYLARVVTRDRELSGATAPGFPALILGHNGRIAWGITSSHADVEDVFLERVHPEDATRYDTPGGRQPFAVREELIAVRDSPAETLFVRSTRHGPVISDLIGTDLRAPASPDDNSGEARLMAALAATYLRDDDLTAEALFSLNRAGNWGEFRSAAEAAASPQQNVFYADLEGQIGFISAGLIPLRPAGGGWMPVEGWTESLDWASFVPSEGMPKALNPHSGRLANANNRPVPLDYPWPISGAWDAGFRAARIEDGLEQTAPQTVESTAALQLDSVSLMARRLLPIMLDNLPRLDRYARVIERLRSWDGSMSHDRPEPLIFAAWLRQVVRALCEDELGTAFNEYWDYQPRFVEAALTARTQWCDVVGTMEVEDCPSRLQAALDWALQELSRTLGPDHEHWRWGALHQARFQHPLWRRIPLIGRLLATSSIMNGGNDTINRSASRLSDNNDPFAAVHGASFRGVYDLADLGNSRMILATGQSGNPLSRHFRDMMPLWRDGGGIRLRGTRSELAPQATSSLLLVPTTQPSRP